MAAGAVPPVTLCLYCIVLPLKKYPNVQLFVSWVPCCYTALQELKRQSWRYHKHHNAWFQRYAEPTVTSEEYEQGTYVYFDYNIMHDDLQTGWCYRRKENFTFR